MEALLVGIRKFVLSVVLMFWAVLPEVAWACPYCTQNEGGGMGRVFTLGAMIVFPFLLVPGIIYLIRKNSDQDLPY